MKELSIQKENFSLAENLQNIFENRLVSVSCLSEEDIKHDDPSLRYETYICSEKFSQTKGGEQAVIAIAKKLRASNVMIVNEDSTSFSLETSLGGKLYKINLPESTRAKELSISDNFGLQMVANLVKTNNQMVSGSDQSIHLLKLSARVAQADITVFINGPTGTGKEVLSQFIHLKSSRASGPFVPINCAAIPENMLEAILFGHEKGSFTGASTANKGIFRAADSGTLLLDEISEMPMSLQAKLLRVLQEKSVTPLGSQQNIPVDVRVIATTNRDMNTEIEKGNFREDLYYRLNVFPLATKDLYTRKDDIIPITTALLIKHAADVTKIPYLSTNAITKLLNHSWPGNVRELENVIQRALVLQSGNAINDEDIIVDVDPENIRLNESIFKNKHELRLAAE